MDKNVNDIFFEIEGLPHGDMEKDHIILDEASVQTLKLCAELLAGIGLIDDTSYFEDLHFLILAVIKKWETLQPLWYA